MPIAGFQEQPVKGHLRFLQLVNLPCFSHSMRPSPDHNTGELVLQVAFASRVDFPLPAGQDQIDGDARVFLWRMQAIGGITKAIREATIHSHDRFEQYSLKA